MGTQKIFLAWHRHQVRVSLVNEVFLAFRARDHLMRVPGDERVEEGFPAVFALGPEDAVQSLRLFSPPAALAVHLDDKKRGMRCESKRVKKVNEMS